MNVSTSLNINCSVSRLEATRKCAEAGFQVLDMNYWDLQNEMLHKNWREEEEWAREIRTYADHCGARFTQVHGPVHGRTFTSLARDLTLDSFLPLAERSLRTAAILGAPWVVFHPTDISLNGKDLRRSVGI